MHEKQLEITHSFSLHSPSLDQTDVVPEKFVFNGMGCHGKNLSPALSWEGAPEGTKSYVLTVYDPDASAEAGWGHWTVINIPAKINEIQEGASNNHSLPKPAMEIKNDFGETTYGGPCPPKGDKPHRYVFTLYALDTETLNLSKYADRVSLETSLQNHLIGKTSFTKRYSH